MLIFVVCVLAVIIDQWLGDPKKWKHPVIYIGNLIAIFEKNWNKGQFRKFKGFLTVSIVVLCTAFIVSLLVFVAMKINIIVWFVVEVTLISLALAQKSLKEAAMLVSDSLAKADLPEARKY